MEIAAFFFFFAQEKLKKILHKKIPTTFFFPPDCYHFGISFKQFGSVHIQTELNKQIKREGCNL
jgi:hypothetical protein